MALIKFNKESFIESLEPGLVAYIAQQFQNKLEVRLNGIVEEVHKELRCELPEKIKAKIHAATSLMEDETKIAIEIDLRG